MLVKYRQFPILQKISDSRIPRKVQKCPISSKAILKGVHGGLDSDVWLDPSRIRSTGKEKPCSNRKVSKVEHGLYLS